MGNFIQKLEIKNFKSIRDAKIQCKRINVLIGPPNVGKSNVLEALSLFGVPYLRYDPSAELNNYIRFRDMSQLFYDGVVREKITVATDKGNCELSYNNGDFTLKTIDIAKENIRYDLSFNTKGWLSNPVMPNWQPEVKAYRFRIPEKYIDKEYFLLPPFGNNLYNVLLTNNELRKQLSPFFAEYGLRLVVKSGENTLEVQKGEDVVVSLPFVMVSDGLQRMVFYLTAIESNKDSILVFEEPETHYFPTYANILAERIAYSEDNQFFLTTHNPYLLLTLFTKAKKEDINVIIAYYEDGQTKLKELNESEIQEALDNDFSLFFNLNSFTEDAG